MSGPSRRQGPAAAERAAVDALATHAAAACATRAGRIHLVVSGQRIALSVRTWQRPTAERLMSAPRLRFDRVALRVIRALDLEGSGLLPEGVLGLVTVRAPIRVARQLVERVKAALAGLTETAPNGRARKLRAPGNHVSVAALPAPRGAARVVCLVHTAPRDGRRLLTMARDSLALGNPVAARYRGAAWLLVNCPERRQMLPLYRHLFESLAVRPRYQRVYLAFRDGHVAKLAG